MMPGKTVTLKDIAERCGVSATVVSAVLNNRRGRISCSDERREQILRVAAECNYQVNILARTMKMKHVPIIGIMVHWDKSTQDERLVRPSIFFEYLQAQMTISLNRKGLEVLFIPYLSEAEQVSRLRKLIGYGLIGGVVTNIIPESHHAICDFLSDDPLPYMVLGRPYREDVYCAYPASGHLNKRIVGVAEQKGCSRCYQVVPGGAELEFREYPFPDDYMYSVPARYAGEIDFSDPGQFFALFGLEVWNKWEQAGYPFANTLLVETESRASLVESWPGKLLILADHCILGNVTDYTVTSLCNWLNEKEKPRDVIHRFLDADSDIRVFRA